MLENVLEQLSTQQMFRSRGILSTPENKKSILNKLGSSNVNINVTLGKTRITVEDFLDLKVGDVLRLDNQVTEDLVISVNGKPKFLGRPGTRKNKLAVTITDTINSLENLK